MVKKTVEKALAEYKSLVRREIKDPIFFVYGSVATGNIRTDSDIDLIVVSSSFHTVNGMKRMEWLSRLRRGSARRVPMDIIGFTPEEFKSIRKEKNMYWKDIIKTMRKV
ncbi:MAG TPA: hypothetical protein DCY48_01285 [Candidatus Magasanikbacteria bacterium]|nr:MAG: hypothetical protein A3I74_03755 [Candidatus Magasanikbacteria bacterium RIFCSPLOWO2_02_FULL_47_16]OGH80192.1 MAG: hypothetical protein A3C10_03340 [Candidatus Magasanikbacteria bacterium RIFCSPHIGHO2_02_FULL_48_18]HAZ28391.1 hypothetical protein [Candidatus Magasanikbacteria bacterium]